MTKQKVCDEMIRILKLIPPGLYDQGTLRLDSNGRGCVWAHLRFEPVWKYLQRDGNYLFSRDEIRFIIPFSEDIKSIGDRLSITRKNYGVITLWDAIDRVKIVRELKVTT